MTLRSIGLVAMVFLAISCGGARPPASLVDLERLTSGPDATRIMEHAPGSWSEGVRYLSLAREASKGGDSVQADRFARLGALHIKIGVAAQRQAAYRKKLEVALQEKQDIAREEERLRSQLAHIETARERQGMREHLENVLDETLIKAAAKEALSGHKPTDKKGKNAARARLRVGREMIARAKIWQNVLQVHVSTGVLEKEKTAFLGREIGQAREKLGALDMVGLQKHLETAGIGANRLLDTIWFEKERSRTEHIETISSKLSAGGFQLTQESFGPAVSFVISGSRRTKNWPGQIEKLGTMLAEMDHVQLVVLASSGEPDGLKKMLKKSHKRATATAEILVKSGLEKAQLHPCGFGGASPLKSLQAGRERVAVLIVPTVPE